MTETLTAAQLRAVLLAECERAGGQNAWARKVGLTSSLVSMTLTGARDISTSIANALGYAVQPRFVPMRRVQGGTGPPGQDGPCAA